MARPFVNEIREHDRVQGVFLASRKSLQQTRNGASYLAVTLADKTGELEARAWDNAESLDKVFERGSYVQVVGIASTYAGRMQIKLDSVKPVAKGTVDPRDFMPSTRFDVETMWRELREMVSAVGDEHIRRILEAFLDDPYIGPAFRRAPAAKNVHHAWVGGLLEHTLSVMQLAHRIADQYPRANRDLLVAGAMLHDIGKTRELSVEDGIDYTTEGRLVGHMIFSIQWIHEKAAKIPGFPAELEMHLAHLVAAHHGELEKGSPKVPQTLEAMIVHALDELDSRVQSWTTIIEADTGAEWTAFQRLYERFLYKGPGWRGEKDVPEGRPWTGQSFYRREALGQLPARTTTTESPETPEEERPPVPIDLFSRPRK